MRKWLIVVLALASLPACKNQVDGAVDACYNDVMSRVRENLGTVDRDQMAESAKLNDDGTMQIDSTVVFRAGTPQETKQTFNCTVSLNGPNGQSEPRVIRLAIQW